MRGGTDPEAEFGDFHTFMQDSVLKPHAVKELRRCGPQSIGMATKHLRGTFVDDASIDTTTSHPVCSS